MNTFFIMVIVALLAQAAPATVDGIVIKMGSGEPLAGARVELHPERSRIPTDEPPETYTATSSQDGKFVLNGVRPGPYRLIATRNGGYVPAEYGQRSPTGQGIPFELSAGQRMSGIQLAMATTGVIAGRVYDRDGEPIGKAQVQALRTVYKDGRRALTIVQTTQTNVIGADGGRVSGSVVNARQEPLSNRTVVLAPDVRLRHRIDLYKTTTSDSSGQFQIQGVAPGSYQLFAWEDVETGAWMDPEFIRVYEGRGKAVQVNEGGNENLQVTVIP